MMEIKYRNYWSKERWLQFLSDHEEELREWLAEKTKTRKGCSQLQKHVESLDFGVCDLSSFDRGGCPYCAVCCRFEEGMKELRSENSEQWKQWGLPEWVDQYGSYNPKR